MRLSNKGYYERKKIYNVNFLNINLTTINAFTDFIFKAYQIHFIYILLHYFSQKRAIHVFI